MSEASTWLHRPLFQGPAAVTARTALWAENDLPPLPPPRLPFMYTPMQDIVDTVARTLRVPAASITPAMSYTLVTWWQDVRAQPVQESKPQAKAQASAILRRPRDLWRERISAWWDSVKPSTPRFALWVAVVHEWKAAAKMRDGELRRSIAMAAVALDTSSSTPPVKKEELVLALRSSIAKAQGSTERRAAVTRAATDARLKDIFPLGPDILQRSGPVVPNTKSSSPYVKALQNAEKKSAAQAAALLSGILRRSMIQGGQEDGKVVSTFPLLLQLRNAEKRAVESRLGLNALENVYDEFAALGWGLANLVIDVFRHLQLVEETYEEHKYTLRIPRIPSDKSFTTVDAVRNLAFELRTVLRESYVPRANPENPDAAHDITQRFDEWVLRPVLKEQGEGLRKVLHTMDDGTLAGLEASAHRMLGLGAEDGPYARVERLLKAVRTQGATQSWLSVEQSVQGALRIQDLDVREVEASLSLDLNTLDTKAVERVAKTLWSQKWYQQSSRMRSARALRYFVQEVADWEDRKQWLEALSERKPEQVDASDLAPSVPVQLEYEGPPRVTRVIGLKSNTPSVLEGMKKLAASQFPGAEVYVAGADV